MGEHAQVIAFEADLSRIRRAMDEVKSEAAKGITIPFRTGEGSRADPVRSADRAVEIASARAASAEVDRMRATQNASNGSQTSGVQAYFAGAVGNMAYAGAAMPPPTASPNWSYLMAVGQQAAAPAGSPPNAAAALANALAANQAAGGLGPPSLEAIAGLLPPSGSQSVAAPSRARGSMLGGLDIGRIAGLGIIANSAGRALMASQQYGTAMMLAGSDQSAQLAATMEYRQRLLSQPLAGPIVSFLEDPSGTQTAALDATSRSARNQDQRTQLMRRNADFALGLASEAAQARSGTSSFEADRLRAVATDRMRRADIAEINGATAESDARAIADRQAVLAATRDARIKELAGGLFDDARYKNGKLVTRESAAAEIDLADQTEIGRMRSERADKLKARTAQALADADVIFGANKDDIDRRQESFRQGTEAQRLGQSGFKLAAALKAIDADFTPVFGKDGRLVAIAGVEQSKNAQEFGEKLARYNLAQAGATADYQREQILSNGDMAAASLRLSRRPMQAAVTQVLAEMAAGSIGAPLGSPQWTENIVRGHLKMAGIAQQFGDDAEMRQISQTAVGRVLAAQLSRDPLGASLEGIEGRRETALADARQAGKADQTEIDRINSNFDRERELALRNEADADRRTQLGLSGRQMQINELMNRNRSPLDSRTAAEAIGIAFRGMQEALPFFESGKTGFGRQVLNQTIDELQLQKQNILDSFRGSQSDPRLVMGSSRDSFDGTSLKSITDAIGRVEQAMRDFLTTVQR